MAAYIKETALAVPYNELREMGNRRKLVESCLASSTYLMSNLGALRLVLPEILQFAIIVEQA